MAKNKLDDLRNHLFAALEGLSDKDNPMDLERAQAIMGVAQVLVNSAKVEVEYMKVTGQPGTDFIQTKPALPAGSTTTSEIKKLRGIV